MFDKISVKKEIRDLGFRGRCCFITLVVFWGLVWGLRFRVLPQTHTDKGGQGQNQRMIVNFSDFKFYVCPCQCKSVWVCGKKVSVFVIPFLGKKVAGLCGDGLVGCGAALPSASWRGWV